MSEIAEHLKKDAFAKFLGIEQFQCADGSWSVRMRIEERHLNGLEGVHGGAVFALADCAFAMAANTDGRVTVGMQASIAYVASAKPGTVLVARTKEVSRRNTVSLYEVEIRTEPGDALIAHFTGTGFTLKKV